MNIFALTRCPIESAKQMIDKHVIKMPTESCQMLHTNALFMDFVDRYGYEPSLRRLKEYHEEEQSILMKPAMLNHPSTIWARQTDNNTMWLFQHALALCEEYTVRYGKVHGTYERILHTPIEYDADYQLATPPLVAMADEYRIPNTYGEHCWEFVIDSYRHYYLEGKWRFAEWKTERPIWWPVNHINMRWNAMFDRINKQNNLSLPLKMLPLVVE